MAGHELRTVWFADYERGVVLEAVVIDESDEDITVRTESGGILSLSSRQASPDMAAAIANY